MIDVQAQILGSKAVQTRLLGITPEVQKRVRTEVERQGLEVLRLAKEKLTDDVLHVRTGRLRRSVNEKTSDDGSTFTASVGTNLVYAKVHEKGFQGDVAVREYLRRTKGSLKAAKSLGWKDGKGKLTSAKVAARSQMLGACIVHAFTRHMNVPARPFLAPSLNERKGEIRAGLMRAMNGMGGSSGR